MRSKRALDPETRDLLRRHLRAELARLADGVRKLDRPLRAAPELLDGVITGAPPLGAEIRSALLRRRRRQLAELEAGLARLDRGEYGICRDCQMLIGLRRLRALPLASRCARCQGRAVAATRAARRVGPLVGDASSSSGPDGLSPRPEGQGRMPRALGPRRVASFS